MENANRALIIAGAVLIAIVILSMGAYFFAKFSNQNRQYKEMVSNIEIQKYNSNFDIYIGRTDIKAQEIASAMYLAKEYHNMSVVTYAGGEVITQDNPETILRRQYINETYSCTNYTYSNNGIITSISFTKN